MNANSIAPAQPMKILQMQCRACHGWIKYDLRHAGMKGNCPQCGNEIVAPTNDLTPIPTHAPPVQSPAPDYPAVQSDIQPSAQAHVSPPAAPLTPPEQTQGPVVATILPPVNPRPVATMQAPHLQGRGGEKHGTIAMAEPPVRVKKPAFQARRCTSQLEQVEGEEWKERPITPQHAEKSKLPMLLLILIFFVAAGGGGAWWYLDAKGKQSQPAEEATVEKPVERLTSR